MAPSVPLSVDDLYIISRVFRQFEPSCWFICCDIRRATKFCDDASQSGRSSELCLPTWLLVNCYPMSVLSRSALDVMWIEKLLLLHLLLLLLFMEATFMTA